ncbi:hypothetical protein FA95DRAFT_1605625 [Auriscalpium vulgare]|uniref:Uncharacterized protein n=1 Tax=Auriscalpium vulgare TaxID=40419 RepID=A0ACB8RWI0_9AGAM|nr:hypothetical protein FA95DRAFT_1605625 [Auriscalpium vulgare]
MADPAHPNFPPAPMHGAPVEIIGRIICYALSGPLEHDHDERVSTILRVCQRWNAIAMGLKEFRSHQFVPRPGADTESTRALVDYLAPYPIRICTCAQSWRMEDDPEDDVHRRVIALPTHPILGPLAIALRNVSRIREVRLIGEEGGYNSKRYDNVRYFFQCLGPPSPDVEESVPMALEGPLAQMILEDPLGEMAPEELIPMAFERLEIGSLHRKPHSRPFNLENFPIDPRFNFVSLRNITLNSCGLDFTSAAIFRSPVLTTVDLKWHGMERPGVWENNLAEWALIVDALGRMTMVETLKLEFALPRTLPHEIFKQNQYPRAVYVLPSLQQFIIGGHPITVIKLLNHIRFPHSASLFLSFCLGWNDLRSPPDSHISSSITDYFSTSSAPFRSLIIEGHPDDEVGLGCSWVFVPPPDAGRGDLRVGTLTQEYTVDPHETANQLHEYLVDVVTQGKAELLKEMTHVTIRGLPEHLTAEVFSRILASLSFVEELVISGNGAVHGWMFLKISSGRNARMAMKNPVPRLRIMDATFDPPNCSSLLFSVLHVARQGCKVTVEGCNLLQVNKDLWRQASHLIRGGRQVFKEDA